MRVGRAIEASEQDDGDTSTAGDGGLRQRRGERQIAVLLLCSIAGAVVLAVVYVQGGQPQLEAVFLFVALSGLGGALVVWAHRLLPDEQTDEPWQIAAIGDDEEAAEAEALAATIDTGGAVSRRPLLRRLLLGALGALGLAALFPIRSLGPRPAGELRSTGWAGGRALVDQSGRRVRASGVPVGGLVTVFPEGHTDAPDAAAVLVRLDDRTASQLRDERADGAPEGLVAYSKLCTHAGCPVGLYLADTRTLLCPCHQSEFDVLSDARPISGPAVRRLPRLSLRVTDDGEVTSTGDFSEPVGPAWWSR